MRFGGEQLGGLEIAAQQLDQAFGGQCRIVLQLDVNGLSGGRIREGVVLLALDVGPKIGELKNEIYIC